MYFSSAVIFLLIVLDILVYYLSKHVENNGECKNPSFAPYEQDHGERKDSSSLSLLDKHCRRFLLDEIKVATHDFDDAFVIGKGGFGKVYKGKLDLKEVTEVAIKRSDSDANQGKTEFWAEIEMLSKFRHSHIVSLVGYCEEKNEMIIVYEYLPNGSLDDHLHKKKANGRDSSSLTWVQRLNICVGVARGLDYLHTGTDVQFRVIHRDVKSSNILLDGNFAAKISDFGVSRIGPAYQLGTTNVYTGLIIGTFGYMDAEYFSTHRLTRKSDVYAFGVVLLEVLCGRPALDFRLEEQQHSLAGWAKQCIKEGKLGQIIDPCLKGQVSGNCLKEFGQIAYDCLRNCSKDRPTMTKVLAKLEFVLAWTLRSQQNASDRKHIGRTILIDKAWSLFSAKAPIRMTPDTEKLKQSDGNKKKGITVEKSDGHSGVIATVSQKVVSPPPRGETMAPLLKEFTYSELKIATKNFRKDRRIGEGGFGIVFKGWLDSVTYEPLKDGNKIPVAIKKSKHDSTQGLKEWKAELIFLGNLTHPNLVKLFGYHWENKDYFLVYEYMQKGSLENLLFRRDVEPLTWETRIKIAMGAAQGLAFLHNTENNVICRDLKSSNILLDEDFNAKLSDFGLAKSGPVYDNTHVSTAVVGTYGYAAPEYIITGRIYIKSDVYAFGVLMLEIITGLRVIDRGRPQREHNLVKWATPFLNKREGLPRIMDPRLEQDYPLKGAGKAAELILSCLQQNPRDRPSMEEVLSSLQVISAIKMKPSELKSKSKAKTRSSSNLRDQNSINQWSTKQVKGTWSTRSWLSGLKKFTSSKKKQARTETDRTKTEKWGN